MKIPIFDNWVAYLKKNAEKHSAIKEALAATNDCAVFYFSEEAKESIMERNTRDLYIANCEIGQLKQKNNIFLPFKIVALVTNKSLRLVKYYTAKKFDFLKVSKADDFKRVDEGQIGYKIWHYGATMHQEANRLVELMSLQVSILAVGIRTGKREIYHIALADVNCMGGCLYGVSFDLSGARVTPIPGKGCDWVDAKIDGEKVEAIGDHMESVINTVGLQLDHINSPENFIMEEVTKKCKLHLKKRKKLLKSYERPIFTVLRPHAIREKMGIVTKGTGTKAPHDRRAHDRYLSAARFSKNELGEKLPVKTDMIGRPYYKKVHVPAIWVGATSAKVHNKFYVVRTDL